MKRIPVIAAAHCATKLRLPADPTRLSVIEILLAGSKHVGEINAQLGIGGINFCCCRAFSRR
jgi:hypothetical protein